MKLSCFARFSAPRSWAITPIRFADAGAASAIGLHFIAGRNLRNTFRERRAIWNDQDLRVERLKRLLVLVRALASNAPGNSEPRLHRFRGPGSAKAFRLPRQPGQQKPSGPRAASDRDQP